MQVYHHINGFVGEVVKKGRLWCPIGLIKPIPGTRLPDFVSLDVDELESEDLEGWDDLKARVIKLFASDQKEQELRQEIAGFRRAGKRKNADGEK